MGPGEAAIDQDGINGIKCFLDADNGTSGQDLKCDVAAGQGGVGGSGQFIFVWWQVAGSRW